MSSLSRLAMAALGAGTAYGFYRRRKRRDLRGQTALITGSSRGLGFLLAREYARQGCRVVICALDEEELNIARDRLREEEGAEVLAIVCDVTDEHQVQVLVEEATRHFGQIDILVNNAGIIQVGPIEDQSVEDFEAAMAVIFYGTLYNILAVLPQMMERRDGRIVNITSIGGRVSVPHLLPYGAAKFAALGLSEGLRAELGKHKIAVTTIVPGLMRTGSYVHAFFKGRQGAELSWFALGSSLPLITMNAERAARQIVEASRNRKAEQIVGFPAKSASVFVGLFPGMTARLLGLVNRFILPSGEGRHGEAVVGSTARGQIDGPIARLVAAGTTLGRRAGRRYNQR